MKKIFLFFIILLFLFFGLNIIIALNNGADDPPPCIPCYTTYYQCTAGCDGELQKQTCEECCGGGCSGWTTIQDCHVWQMCDARARNCSCAGECLEAPPNPRYFNNPRCPDPNNPECKNHLMSPTNVFLPVKLDWDNVPGWIHPNFVSPLPYPEIIPFTDEQIKIEERVLEEIRRDLPPGAPIVPPDFPGVKVALPINILFQHDPAWGGLEFYTGRTVGRVGCKITSIAMALQFSGCKINNELINPGHITEIIVRDDFWVPGAGTRTSDLIRHIRDRQCPQTFRWARETTGIQGIVDHISKGRPVVAGFRRYGQGTNYGNRTQHWILIRGITEDGKYFIVNDTAANWQRAHGGRISLETIEKFDLISFHWFEKQGESSHLKLLSSVVETNNQPPDDPMASEFYWVNSYRINAAGYRRVLDNSEFIPPSCLFRPGETNNWQVQACCDFEGQDCGSASNWNFTTNNAPELILPQDPDWAGTRKTTNELLSTSLQWCPSNFRDRERNHPLSYKLQVFKVENGKEVCHPSLMSRGRCRYRIIRERVDLFDRYPKSMFSNEEHNFFTRDNTYAWQIAACRDFGATDCTAFSQKWQFQIDDTLSSPYLITPLNDPNGITPVGLPVLLEWKVVLGAQSFRYHIYQGNKLIINSITTSTNIRLNYPQLSIDTMYNWRILPCSGRAAEGCQMDTWSERFFFRTTGRPPKPETMKPTGKDIVIPTSFEWENVPGAKSFRFKIWGGKLDKELITNEPRIFFRFPDLIQETTYSWQVRTCADLKGEVCGEWSEKQTFTTFRLGTPVNMQVQPHKENNIFVGENHTFSWNLAARYHQFKLTYQKAEDEEREKCLNLEQHGKIKILTNNSLFQPLECRGNYQWQVRGCLDEKCIEGGIGNWSDLQNMTLTARVAPEELRAGLVPCGRKFDDPNTKWNETDTCQLKHIFIMFYSVLNFFLWTLIPIILVILVVITGAMFYFSLSTGVTETLPKIRALWRSAGIGIGIILFAWIFISWFLTIFGYQVGIFGPWWRIVL